MKYTAFSTNLKEPIFFRRLILKPQRQDAKLIFMDIKLIVAGSSPWERWTRHWGLSFALGSSFLFDTFANDAVLSSKIQQAGLDETDLRTVILSHAHWDHSGGLWGLLERHQGLDVIVPPHAPQSLKDRVRKNGGCLHDKAGIKTLAPGLYVSDEMQGIFNGKNIYEQAIVQETPQGLIVLLGCSHPGLLNIVQTIQDSFQAPVFGIVGGFHLMHDSAADITACAEALQKAGVTFVAPTHCTGARATRLFQDIFGKNCLTLREGGPIPFPAPAS